MKKEDVFLSNSKSNNRSLTLRLFFAHGILSRTDIADRLNITTAAVTAIVNNFLKTGILMPNDTSLDNQPRAGRKKTALNLNYNWKYILTIDIHSYYVNIAITNLAGEIIVEGDSLLPNLESPEMLCSSIAKECIKMLWQASISASQILGAGITIIGPVNQNLGIALHPFRLFDEAVPIKEYFEKEFSFPVAVESNVCAFLQSELLYTNLIEEAPNTLMLKWGPGVGSSMAIRGQVYKGHNYQSTEIGHNQIAETGGKKCNCGCIGCLEPSISIDAIVEFIQEEAQNDPSGFLAQLAQNIGRPSRQNLNQFLKYDVAILWEFIRQCAHSLASVTNNAIHILAPDRLILMGDLFENDTVAKIFTEQLFQINPTLPDNLCHKCHSQKNQKYIGATAAAINQILLTM